MRPAPSPAPALVAGWRALSERSTPTWSSAARPRLATARLQITRPWAAKEELVAPGAMGLAAGWRTSSGRFLQYRTATSPTTEQLVAMVRAAATVAAAPAEASSTTGH